jgi:hypothetical protein
MKKLILIGSLLYSVATQGQIKNPIPQKFDFNQTYKQHKMTPSIIGQNYEGFDVGTDLEVKWPIPFHFDIVCKVPVEDEEGDGDLDWGSDGFIDDENVSFKLVLKFDLFINGSIRNSHYRQR